MKDKRYKPGITARPFSMQQTCYLLAIGAVIIAAREGCRRTLPNAGVTDVNRVRPPAVADVTNSFPTSHTNR